MTLRSHEDFVAGVEPLTDAVLDLVRFHKLERERLAPEAAQGSSAFQDDLRAHRFAGIDGHPTAEPRLLAGLQLAMVEELITSYVRLVTTEPAVIMSDKVLVRSVIEISGRALWMCDPEVDTNARVARALLERIEGIRLQLNMVKGRHPDASEERAERIRDLHHQAERAGFVVAGGTRKQPLSIGGEVRPGSSRSVKLVLDRGSEPGEAWIGDLGQKYLSMFVHGNIPAMVMQRSDEHSIALDQELVGAVLVMSTQWVNLMTGFCALSYVTATNAYRDYVGWVDERWLKLKLNYRGVSRRVMPDPPEEGT